MLHCCSEFNSLNVYHHMAAESSNIEIVNILLTRRIIFNVCSEKFFRERFDRGYVCLKARQNKKKWPRRWWHKAQQSQKVETRKNLNFMSSMVMTAVTERSAELGATT